MSDGEGSTAGSKERAMFPSRRMGILETAKFEWISETKEVKVMVLRVRWSI